MQDLPIISKNKRIKLGPYVDASNCHEYLESQGIGIIDEQSEEYCKLVSHTKYTLEGDEELEQETFSETGKNLLSKQ